ncbi:MAG: hypothetical protein NWR45_04680 [Candidatus Nanopelagicales bacterium]|jgi:hypothetical protein|nr:hypothetical protein [Candidatus Nanopelagicales bacterium]
MTHNEPFVAPQRSALRKAADTNVHPSTPTDSADLPAFNTGNTGDSVLRGKSEKTVAMEVQIPKSLRKRLRTRAGELDISVDELTSRILRDGLN